MAGGACPLPRLNPLPVQLQVSLRADLMSPRGAV